jgi:hypothetical protein
MTELKKRVTAAALYCAREAKAAASANFWDLLLS